MVARSETRPRRHMVREGSMDELAQRLQGVSLSHWGGWGSVLIEAGKEVSD